jgi:hypothetical protein
VQFNPNVKEHHWGERKLKRDQMNFSKSCAAIGSINGTDYSSPEIRPDDVGSLRCVPLEGVAMKYKISASKGQGVARLDYLELLERLIELQKLREEVRLAEVAIKPRQDILQVSQS